MVSKLGTSIEKGRPLMSRDKTKHNQICLWSSWRLYINLINIVPSFVFSSYLLVSKRGRLVAGRCVIGLSTKDPSIQKELTEVHKIPTFGVYGKKYWTRYSYWNSPNISLNFRYFNTKRGDFVKCDVLLFWLCGSLVLIIHRLKPIPPPFGTWRWKKEKSLETTASFQNWVKFDPCGIVQLNQLNHRLFFQRNYWLMLLKKFALPTTTQT